ncbi:MAG: CbtA family protein [Alphaproteobacteria bacterium]
MTAFRSLFLVALLAGSISGVFVTVVHQVATVPAILAAEVYEGSGGPAHQHEHAQAAAETGGAAHMHDEEAWAPQDGIERTAYTMAADILTGIGFALVLVALYALRGERLDWRRGLAWGLGGFAAVTLAPSLGLPPEVPGTEAAALAERQIWWLATVACTGGGLALIFLGKRAIYAVLGLALIVLPHAYGAPQPEIYGGLAPEALAHRFIVAVTVSSLLFWAVLGLSTGLLYDRFVRPAA